MKQPVRHVPRVCIPLRHCRWDASKAATADNLVLLTQTEADEHEALWEAGAAAEAAGGQEGAAGRQGLALLRAREPELVARVEATLDRVRRELFY